jgi:pre-rRNA-processing protein TSR3
MVLPMSKKIKLYVKFEGGYDPYAIDKCTAARCASHGLMKVIDKIPNSSLLLYPFANEYLTVYDKSLAEAHGIYLIDAPWDILPAINSRLSDDIRRRKLINVREVQGPSKGSDYKISTAGAAAYALFILGYREQAEELLDVFPWKDDFIKENFRNRR